MGATNIFWMVFCLVSIRPSSAVNYADNPSVKLLQEYLQIDTTSGSNLTAAVEFWQKLAAAENLPISVYEFTEGYPVVVIKWAGTDPSTNSIMLNSHMDVVPADEKDGWTYPPFSAHLDKHGNIYARGSLDMKSVSIQYFEAMKKLKANNVKLLRDVYMTLMPDEETSGSHGIIPFLKSEQFQALKVGVAMDEGAPFDMDLIALFYQDKVVWQFQIECYGDGGHSALFPATNSTATGQCTNVINRLFEYRDEQYEIFLKGSYLEAGTYSSVNLNKLNGGTANNIIPSDVTLVFDMRPAISLNADTFETQLRQWLDEAGTNITLKYITRNKQSPATTLNDTNPYWVAISEAVKTLNIKINPMVTPGSTDARYVRDDGIPAFGFSPLPNTPLLLHSVNEYINAEIFLNGITIYQEFVKNMANIPADQTVSTPFAYVHRTDV